MAAGLGADSLAAKFKAGDGLEGYLGRWLLLQVAGGDVEAEDNMATSRQIPPIRTVVGEKLNMEYIGPQGEKRGEQGALGGGPRGGRQYISPKSSSRRGGIEIDGA